MLGIPPVCLRFTKRMRPVLESICTETKRRTTLTIAMNEAVSKSETDEGVKRYYIFSRKKKIHESAADLANTVTTILYNYYGSQIQKNIPINTKIRSIALLLNSSHGRKARLRKGKKHYTADAPLIRWNHRIFITQSIEIYKIQHKIWKSE